MEGKIAGRIGSVEEPCEWKDLVGKRVIASTIANPDNYCECDVARISPNGQFVELADSYGSTSVWRKIESVYVWDVLA